MSISEATGPPTNIPHDAPTQVQSFLRDGCFPRDPAERWSAKRLLEEHPYMTCSDQEIDTAGESFAQATSLCGQSDAFGESRMTVAATEVREPIRPNSGGFADMFDDLDAYGAQSTFEASRMAGST